ncbi:TPA: transglycosylase domain-containing protein [Pseudomonas aeruginosa]|nr:transglycosylase domain-containing protein [Pseudomonas aeruginosa]HEN8756580.1 transglycosylase domain-containing protein [Pseudomonas aeruginosa]HEN8804975.1 transglycosylase domain-containing protein [Pseudomonas aeruginosa]
MNSVIRPIRTHDDLHAVLEEIERLLDSSADSSVSDRLEILTVLVQDYERKHHRLPAPDPVDLLGFAMQAQGRSQADLAKLLGSRSRASEVLNRRRLLSKDMIEKIASAWSLPPSLLAAPYQIGSRVKRAALRVGGIALAVVVATMGSIGGVFWHYGKSLPDATSLVAYSGSGLDGLSIVEAGRENYSFVPLADIPPHVIMAFLAAEDQNYYTHGGYDPYAIVRASLFALPDDASGRQISGASTITQQLAKNVLLSEDGPTLRRKIRELILAHRLEQSLNKERILELYLNVIYFGGDAWGLDAASQFYFHKRPADLAVAEAAYLAALPKAPNFYRIDEPDNIERALARRNWVLTRMASDGLITMTAARFAQAEPLVYSVSR